MAEELPFFNLTDREWFSKIYDENEDNMNWLGDDDYENPRLERFKNGLLKLFILNQKIKSAQKNMNTIV